MRPLYGKNAAHPKSVNPPEWTRQAVFEFPGSTTGPWSRYVHIPDARGIGTVRYPRLIPKDAASAKHLQKRTLTIHTSLRPVKSRCVQARTHGRT